MGVCLARALSLSDENGRDNENIEPSKEVTCNATEGYDVIVIQKTQIGSNDSGNQIER